MSSLQHQVLTWDYFEMYDAEKQSDAVRETLKRPPNTFSSPEASDRQNTMLLTRTACPLCTRSNLLY